MYLKLTLILPCDVKEIIPVIGTMTRGRDTAFATNGEESEDEDLLDM